MRIKTKKEGVNGWDYLDYYISKMSGSLFKPLIQDGMPKQMTHEQGFHEICA